MNTKDHWSRALGHNKATTPARRAARSSVIPSLGRPGGHANCWADQPGQPTGRQVATKELDRGPCRSFKIPRHDAKERTDEGRFFAA